MGKYFSSDTLSVLSSLIGLARALENDPEPLDDVISLLLSVTADVSSGSFSPSPEKVKESLIEAKKKTVPSCFVCQHPCGHNDDYSEDKLSDLDRESTMEIFTLLSSIIPDEKTGKEKKRELCLKSILYISSDWGDEYIKSLISSLREYI